MKKSFDSTQELVTLITERRKELGISQTELAKLCDLSVNGISKFESNAGDRELKLSTLFKINQTLGFKLLIELEE
mgnify:CR=1 FL=1